MTEIIRVSNFLRYVLWADAATCLAFGLLLTIGAGFLESLLGLPANLMFYAGVSLFPFTAFVLFTTTQKSISKTAIWIIICVNILWIIDSFLLLFLGYNINNLGSAIVILQALGVLIFTITEFFLMQKSEVVVFKDTRETV